MFILNLRMFQSTHPRRVRPCRFSSRTASAEFQSTHPRRVRRSVGTILRPPDGFNPRTHVGCDLQGQSLHNLLARFNPRTHVGCDVQPYSATKATTRFQSTHPRRVRPAGVYRNTDKGVVSIHAPT